MVTVMMTTMMMMMTDITECGVQLDNYRYNRTEVVLVSITVVHT